MKACVLIVEDDLDIAENLRDLLEIEGYTAAIARDGREALDILGDESRAMPAIILLDLMMPVMDGFRFREEQRNHPKWREIPVVVMTAGGNIEAKIKKLDVQAFFKKPLDVDELFSIMEQLLVSGY